jgi:hypothetical protein
VGGGWGETVKRWGGQDGGGGSNGDAILHLHYGRLHRGGLVPCGCFGLDGALRRPVFAGTLCVTVSVFLAPHSVLRSRHCRTRCRLSTMMTTLMWTQRHTD